MKIISLTAENWMRLEAVNIEFVDSGAFVIGGENDQGKTAVLKLVRAILGGKSELPAIPVRVGETVALGELTLGGGDGDGDEKKVIVVTLTMTNEGGYKLKVRSRDGASYSRPATMLADLISAVTFNPLDILKMSPKEQRALFFRLAGLNFEKLDGRRQRLSDERITVGRDVAGRQRAIDEMPHFSEAPAEEVVVSALAEELREAQECNQRVYDAEREVLQIQADIQGKQSDIKKAEKQETEWAQIAKNARAACVNLEKKQLDAANAFAAMPRAETEEIITQMRNAEVVNAKVRANAARAQVRQQFDCDHAKYEMLTEDIKAVDAAKRKMLADAKFSVEGLEFPSDGGVLYRGLPLEQDSGSGQLIRAVEIAAAMAPTLRTLLVDAGEQLGNERLKALDNWAQENDYQIIMTRVSTGPECSIVIEDGKIKKETAAVGVGND